MKDVKKMFVSKIIINKDAVKGSKDYKFYHKIQRLHLVSSDSKIILNYFYCVKCKELLNIDTGKCNNSLKRHYDKCIGGGTDTESDEGRFLSLTGLMCTIINKNLFHRKCGENDIKRRPQIDPFFDHKWRKGCEVGR